MRIYEQTLGKVSLTPAGDWENKEYDRLCLVRHPSTGNVYLSKKVVPYDEENPIDVTNTEYWMLVLEGASHIEVDSEFSATSENPVQNKVIYNMLHAIEQGLDNILGE